MRQVRAVTTEELVDQHITMNKKYNIIYNKIDTARLREYAMHTQFRLNRELVLFLLN